jgi:hypothetical protein
MTRYYGLLLAPGNRLQLVKMLHRETVLAEVALTWQLGEICQLTLEVSGRRLIGSVNDRRLIESSDDALDAGAVGLIIAEGRLEVLEVQVRPSG